jgi:FkbM family methyltransferase
MLAMSHLLNKIVPMPLKVLLRRAADGLIPSLRHLDMGKRMKRLKALGVDPKVIYDVGAARGEWSRFAHELWPAARIVGVEPNERNVPLLDQVKRDLPAFDYRRAFLGPEKKVVKYVERDTQTSLVDNAGVSGAANAEAQMTTLDDVAAELGAAPQLLKMDVQGFELEVLKGATRSLTGIEVILLEANFIRFGPQLPLAHEVIAFLAERGFVIYDVAGIYRRRVDDSLGQLDLIFVPEKSKLRASSEW